ncbi:hypothetical protein [Sphingomonas sp.]|uniref:hypothetical protein n=1 Tax=Sphingomonas sp. TaxID=28214 RepID=UPI0035C86AF1
MAGWMRPYANALESFDPWQGVPAPETDFFELERYWNDPAYRDQLDRETAQNRALANAAIDRGMAASRARQAARWAAEEAEGRA